MPAHLLESLDSLQMAVPPLKKPRLYAGHNPAEVMLFIRAFNFPGRPSPPIEQLPDEILSEILFFAVASTADRLDATLLPVTLSHVSSRWRRVALSTSSLWTRVTITYPVTREQLSLTAHCLWRSRAQPLDILLDLRDPSWDWELAESDHRLNWKDVDVILRMLLAQVKRWKRIELLSDIWMPIYAFLCYTRHVETAPLLEAVHLFRCNFCFADSNAVFSPRNMRAPVPFFGNAVLDRLSDVTLVGVHVDWSSPCLRNLKRLEVKYIANDVAPSMDEFLNLLKASPGLRYLSIAGRGPKPDGPQTKHSATSETSHPPLHLELPHLCEFRIGFLDSDHAVQLLRRLRASNLQSLTIQGMYFELGVPLPKSIDSTSLLTSLLEDNGGITLSTITSLALEDVHAPIEAFSNFYNDLHDLQCLTLYRTANTSVLALSPNQNSLPCGKLGELKCHNQDPTVVIDTIEARSRTLCVPTPQPSTSFTTTEEIPTLTLHRLYDLGVDVTLQSQTDSADDYDLEG